MRISTSQRGGRLLPIMLVAVISFPYLGYLLAYQHACGHWKVGLDRRPAEASDFTTNFLAVRALKRFSTPHQKQQIVIRLAAVRRWLSHAAVRDTEDEVFRLRLARELAEHDQDVHAVRSPLMSAQHDGGGWGQVPDMEPDAYATGSVLTALFEAGDIPTEHPVWQRGLNYLLKTQRPDGSWHVGTRAKPMQAYFESKFLHGRDPFISTFATGCSTKALLLRLRKESKRPPWYAGREDAAADFFMDSPSFCGCPQIPVQPCLPYWVG